MNTKYRLGVLGLGEGRSIISAALESSRWELESICDLNEALGAARVREFSLPEGCFTTSYEAMLGNPAIDAIGIYTPDPLHGRHIRMALESGKHVIVTKPVLTNSADSTELLALQEKIGKQVFVGQSSRFFEPMIHQRRDYEAGKNGELTTVEAFYKTDARWFLDKPWTLKGGFSWMLNFMIHAVDLACWYLPEVQEVYAMGYVSPVTRELGLEIPDVIRVLLRDRTGRIAQVEGNYTTPALKEPAEPSISCTLRGTRGASRAEYQTLRYSTHFEGEGPVVHNLEEKAPYYFRFEGRSHHAGEYQNYIETFADSLDAGITALPDLREATGILRVMEAAEESIRTGLPVRIR